MAHYTQLELNESRREFPDDWSPFSLLSLIYLLQLIQYMKNLMEDLMEDLMSRSSRVARTEQQILEIISKHGRNDPIDPAEVAAENGYTYQGTKNYINRILDRGDISVTNKGRSEGYFAGGDNSDSGQLTVRLGGNYTTINQVYGQLLKPRLLDVAMASFILPDAINKLYHFAGALALDEQSFKPALADLLKIRQDLSEYKVKLRHMAQTVDSILEATSLFAINSLPTTLLGLPGSPEPVKALKFGLARVTKWNAYIADVNQVGQATLEPIQTVEAVED